MIEVQFWLSLNWPKNGGIVKKMTKFSVVFCLMMFAALAASGGSFSQCPPVDFDTSGCEFLITVTAVDGTGAATSFSVAASNPDLGPYDGIDDTLLGIQNSSGSTLNSITLTSGTGGLDIFNFDGDGACDGFYGATTAGPPPAVPCGAGPLDPSGYAPTGVTFSGVNASFTTGTVNFSPGIADGSSNWFSLEEALTVTTLTGGTPEPATFGLIGMGLTALYFVRRRVRT